MTNVFSGVEGAPSGDRINMTFQKMAGVYLTGKLLILNLISAFV